MRMVRFVSLQEGPQGAGTVTSAERTLLREGEGGGWF